MARITVVFTGSHGYRVHREGCADIRREPGARATITYPEGTNLKEIAHEEYSDFINEGSMDADDALGIFEGEAKVLPCTKGHLGELDETDR